ncbi:hypothetical protein BB560_002901 [Smittium megazygosporum]|uniref:Uncharacterized protein n=1 Tax=Smittium megazygosporum TaxID=133381 RepID=A0A2T9ZDI1_9FUNG|nr:hypothetical protein BB560_002901 [Smittium megazygosporum]
MIFGLGPFPTFYQASMQYVSFKAVLALDARKVCTLKDIQKCLKFVTNSAKVTESMKMIASTKTTRIQQAIDNAQQVSTVTRDQINGTQIKKNKDAKKIVVVSSFGKNLSDSIRSSILWFTRDYLGSNGEDKAVVIRDKAKAQITSMAPRSIDINFNQVGKSNPTFEEPTTMATEILRNADTPFNCDKIIYNKFISPVTFEPKIIAYYNSRYIEKGFKFAIYKAPGGVLEILGEFLFSKNPPLGYVVRSCY